MHAPDDPIGRTFAVARAKSDLHRAIDALPDDATLILVANACCCGDAAHASPPGTAVYRTVYGEPSVVKAVGMLRMAEHGLIAEGT